jgi:hypothetical protein
MGSCTSVRQNYQWFRDVRVEAFTMNVWYECGLLEDSLYMCALIPDDGDTVSPKIVENVFSSYSLSPEKLKCILLFVQ